LWPNAGHVITGLSLWENLIFGEWSFSVVNDIPLSLVFFDTDMHYPVEFHVTLYLVCMVIAQGLMPGSHHTKQWAGLQLGVDCGAVERRVPSTGKLSLI
jgi:hypothetical protein